jgi:hypothetical protein
VDGENQRDARKPCERKAPEISGIEFGGAAEKIAIEFGKAADKTDPDFAGEGDPERRGENENGEEKRTTAVGGNKPDGVKGELGLGESVRCVRLKQTAGTPGNPEASVAQFTVEKPPTVAVCEKLSKWHSENVIEDDDDQPCTRNVAEFPAIALSEILTEVRI